jgi:hypothetical protein
MITALITGLARDVAPNAKAQRLSVGIMRGSLRLIAGELDPVALFDAI